MIIYEVPVFGETHLLKSYMDISQSFEEPWPNINTGSLVLSNHHKINFYFIDDFSEELQQILPKLSSFLFGGIGIFDWQNQNSFAYLKELLQNVLKAFDLPIVFHAINIIDKMPLKESRLKNGLVLDHTNYIYFSKSVHDQEIINSLTKLIGLVSIQNDKK